MAISHRFSLSGTGYSLLVSCGSLLWCMACSDHDNNNGLEKFRIRDDAAPAVAARVWMAPDTALLQHLPNRDLIRYGRELVANTGRYLGPKGSVSRFANGMNCQNCHLNAGTTLWANSYSAVFANYPKIRARSGMEEDLEKRINDCMQRSMNGKPLDGESTEMKAMQAYINWVGRDVPKDSVPDGASVVSMPYLDRPAIPVKGQAAFLRHCVTCHGEDGQGKLNSDSITYQYPPLWGQHSYTTAAGMYRITRLANYIKSNMPYQLSSYDRPVLTDEEAWDIAGFICSQDRPVRTFPEDWPNISKKPVDHPFGPYADPFTETQHKLGPFPEIVRYVQKHKTP